MGLFLGDLIQFWACEGERLIIRDGCLFEGWCLLLFQLIFKMFNRTRRQKIIKTRQEMVRLKELWAHMYNSVSTPAISLRTVRLIGLDELGSPLGVWGLWLSPFLKCSIGHCMYGNFRPFSRICFCYSPPCNTTTQEQQRVKFNTRVERQLLRPSNIIYTFGANTKPLGAKF